MIIHGFNKFIGPDDWQLFSGDIQPMTFQCRNMLENNDGATVSSLSKEYDYGKIKIVYLKPINTNIIRTELNIGNVYIILKGYNSTFVYIFSEHGNLIKTFDIGTYGDIVSGDTKKFCQFSYTSYLNPSYYSKYDYNGQEISFNTYDAGECNYALGYKTYDVKAKWSTPGGVYLDANTQLIYLYNNDILVGEESFDVTSTDKKLCTSISITDTNVYFCMVEWNTSTPNTVIAYIREYDLDLNFIKETDHESEHVAFHAQSMFANNSYATYSYDLGQYVNIFNNNLENYYSFIMSDWSVHPIGTAYNAALGIIDDSYYWWYKNIATSITYVSKFNLKNEGNYENTYQMKTDDVMETGIIIKGIKL